jgi:hypothetical protein
MEGPDLNALIARDAPSIAKLSAGDVRFAKVIQNINNGLAQKSVDADATDLLRAMVPLISGTGNFVIGTISEQQGFDWVVPPAEPIEKAAPDKDQPPDAPSLRRKPKQLPQ